MKPPGHSPSAASLVQRLTLILEADALAECVDRAMDDPTASLEDLNRLLGRHAELLRQIKALKLANLLGHGEA